MERDFKGIWIPKEIWLSKDLSMTEKVFLVEIQSLDNSDGCYASNSYFGNFFGLSRARVSEVINTLLKKGFIIVEMERKGRQIVRRVIRIGYSEKATKVFGKVDEGYSEKAKDNNTYINNTYITGDFETFWNMYPRKVGKAKAKIAYKKVIKEHEAIIQGLQKYILFWRHEKTETRYILHPTTFLNGRRWEDEIPIKKQLIEQSYSPYDI